MDKVIDKVDGGHALRGRPLISLCMIVGNVESYIERCLSSFAPVVDEICVVRAIGNLKPDRTLAIARQKFGAKTAEYLNAPAHRDWPHVDNFAAARQQSFDMASHEYCLWCDSDDVLEAGGELIREHAAKGDYEAYVFPYRCFGRGLMVPRERLVRRDCGKWNSAVHEFFDFTVKPARAVEDQRVIITHLPGMEKEQCGRSNERNLRILRSIPTEEMTTGLLYHKHLELILSGHLEESVEVAREVLARPDLGTPEKYELFLNLAQVATEPSDRETLLHQAYAADPRRREALGLLATHAMNFCQNERAMAYARQMMATTAPQIGDWNDRPEAYGWVGSDVFAQALRCNGMANEAEALRRRSLQLAGGPRIALIHATRGRPEQAAKCRKEWLTQAERPDRVEHIFVFDSDDELSLPLARMHHLQVPSGGGCVAAWNAGAKVTEAPVLVQMSDDWTPISKWDEVILSRIGDAKKPAVLAISDGHRTDRLLCMAICTRAYYRLDGYLFNPQFTGVFSDNWFTDVAYARAAAGKGKVIEARDLVFRHNHPAFGTAGMDKTYADQNAPARYEEGFKIYQELRSKAVGKLCGQS